jgi:hypothetical protein
MPAEAPEVHRGCVCLADQQTSEFSRHSQISVVGKGMSCRGVQPHDGRSRRNRRRVWPDSFGLVQQKSDDVVSDSYHAWSKDLLGHVYSKSDDVVSDSHSYYAYLPYSDDTRCKPATCFCTAAPNRYLQPN